MKTILGASLLLLISNSLAEERFEFSITANLIAEQDTAIEHFNNYLDAAGPMMVAEGLQVALLTVTDVVGDNVPLKTGDIIGFTRAPAGALQRLFAREDFQAVLPILQASLRGHLGGRVSDTAKGFDWFEMETEYLVEWTDQAAARSKACEPMASFELLPQQNFLPSLERVTLYRGHKATSCRKSTISSNNGYAAQLRLKTVIAE